MDTFIFLSFWVHATYAAIKMFLLCVQEYPFNLMVQKWHHVLDVAYLVAVCIWAASLLNWI
jgi:hypothetical protein